MFNKVGLFLGVLLTYSNPLTALGIKLGFYEGIKKIKTMNRQQFLVRAQTTDLSVLNEIYIRRIYDEALLKRPLCPVIVDVGANIGAFSLRAVSLCHKPKIYAFEPYSKNFKMLQKNVELNMLKEPIKTIKKAVTGDGKVHYLNVEASREGASSMYKDSTRNYHEKERIETVKLADFMEKEKMDCVDLLKLDCEGAEFEILYSLGQKQFDKIKRIVLEYHEYFGTGKVSELKAFLEKHSYKVKVNSTSKLGMMLAER